LLVDLFVDVFLVATFLFDEDVVKATSGSGWATSPDLWVLQDAAHQDVEADALHARREAEKKAN
jgi:hypothetical protein